MRFFIDKNLETIVDAMATPKDAETVAVELCERLIDAKMVEDDAENWCLTVIEAAGPCPVSKVCDILRDYLGTEKIISAVFDAFCALKFKGDGDCPNCGGDLKLYDALGHELNDGTYDVPNSYVIDEYVYECPNCGEIIKTDEEL